jgi:hypothetical protein
MKRRIYVIGGTLVAAREEARKAELAEPDAEVRHYSAHDVEKLHGVQLVDHDEVVTVAMHLCSQASAARVWDLINVLERTRVLKDPELIAKARRTAEEEEDRRVIEALRRQIEERDLEDYFE